MPVNSALHRLALVAALVALSVIVLGAYVRLSHAGLGCPDWPGCYGQLTWPVEAHEITRAEQAFPERPVEGHKAWKQMVHRYLAGFLGGRSPVSSLALAVAVGALSTRGAGGTAAQPNLAESLAKTVARMSSKISKWVFHRIRG